MADSPRAHPLLGLLAWCACVCAWSAIRPLDYRIWLFELTPGFLGLLVVVATYRRMRLSNLLYVLIGLHFAILAVGAKYTYAEMPLFNWLRDTLHLDRNYYDRVGHFAQGFVPAIICREILLRTTPLQPGKMLAFLCVTVCLGISAFWELIEMWVVVLFYPARGPEWLGMQGDVWDAQHDMLLALSGAIIAVLALRSLHDRSLAAQAGAQPVIQPIMGEEVGRK